MFLYFISLWCAINFKYRQLTSHSHRSLLWRFFLARPQELLEHRLMTK